MIDEVVKFSEEISFCRLFYEKLEFFFVDAILH